MEEALRKTMRCWASGVVLVTTVLDGKWFGMTVSSFSVVTLDPPIVLVSLFKESLTFKAIRKSKVLGISILGEEHVEISKIFGHPGNSMEKRFKNLPFEEFKTGVPLLHDALSWMDCEVLQIKEIATHYVIGAKVLETGQRLKGGKPLLYFNRDYRRMNL